MSGQVALLLLVGVSHVVFGLYVLIKGYRKVINRIFFIAAISFSIWNLATGVMIGKLVSSSWLFILFDRLTYLAIPFVAISLILYLRYLLTGKLLEEIKSNKIVLFLMIYGGVCLMLLPTNLISANQGTSEMVVGPLYPLFGGFVLFSAIYLIYSTIIGLRTSKGDKREKFIYALIGFIITSLFGLIFNVALPISGSGSMLSIGPASSFFIVLFMGLGTVGAYLVGSVLASTSAVLIIMFLVALFFAAALFVMLIIASVLFA